MQSQLIKRIKHIKPPMHIGSYSDEDCIFVLKNINGLISENDNDEREKNIQHGGHYSEMLPVEYVPSDEYVNVFYNALEKNAKKTAECVAIVAELVYQKHKENAILVSLARAGTPIGVLIKRYLLFKYGICVPHYSISIIRDKGIDQNALAYIIGQHPLGKIQFIDGWTGKGIINSELHKSVELFNQTYETHLDPSLAVLADPSYITHMRGTVEDFLIPSACLNSTVSGLVSRTVERKDLIGKYDFHGAKFYEKLKEHDISNYYINEISKYFNTINENIISNVAQNTMDIVPCELSNIKRDFGLSNSDRIKFGVGETTRVLLRRVPWKILIRNMNDKNLEHIIVLANERGVPVEEYKNTHYSCVGLIKECN